MKDGVTGRTIQWVPVSIGTDLRFHAGDVRKNGFVSYCGAVDVEGEVLLCVSVHGQEESTRLQCYAGAERSNVL